MNEAPSASAPQAQPHTPARSSEALPYILPFALYMAFLAVQTPERLAWLYPVKTLAVAGALAFFWRRYTELKPVWSALAVVVGVAAIVIWIAIDPLYPGLSRLMGSQPTAPFDPNQITNDVSRLAFLSFRVMGAVLVVPLMEELFWRGFLIRWLVKDDFKSVPVGVYTPFSFWVTVALFGAEHEQWLAGLICGAIYNLLLYRTRSLFACGIAHATSNGLLAVWVLNRGQWELW